MMLHCGPPFFFFNDTATTEIYTLSLHDALPIWSSSSGRRHRDTGTSAPACRPTTRTFKPVPRRDRKSTRLNSSHQIISYAVFCLKKKTHQIFSHSAVILLDLPHTGDGVCLAMIV